MKERTLLLTLTLILMVGCVTKQQDMQNAIRLKSRIFVPGRGVERKLSQYFK